MTIVEQPLPGLDAGAVPVTQPATPRPGSRAARMAVPLARQVLADMCAEYGVCQRPITLRRTNLVTGETEIIDVPCGATREDKCKPCAERARRLRKTQIREGWHRTDEPAPPSAPATPEQRSLISYRAHLEFYRDEAVRAAQWDQVDDLDAAIDEAEQLIAAEGLRGRIAPPREPEGGDDTDPVPARKRSTRRRQDVPDLPRQKVAPRTVGRVYSAPDGKLFQPSMWLTLTLDSYGQVHDDGTPRDPDGYDYRRAAWDAVHFPRLLDRFWQNLRRCVGWNVQYAGCVEPQRRLAPHAHFAIRGTIPRAVLRQVAAATYHQVWWPSIDEPHYTVDHSPVWDSLAEAWVDPDTRVALTSWADALDAIDAEPEALPAHVVRFGVQVRAEGINPGSRDADRTIGYITKYVTKSAAACHELTTDRQRDHLERLWRQLRVTPCSDRCANWLLYGVAPKKAHARLKPGQCKGRVHQRETLGIGGRRILVSRDWSGKTLADHRYDARAWVKAVLGVGLGHEQAPDGRATEADQHDADEHGATTTDVGEQEGSGAYAWELARPDDPDVSPLRHRLMRALAQRIQWRTALNNARQTAGPPLTGVSATSSASPNDKEASPWIGS